ncbi:N-acetyltransferase GCN5 [Terrihabitans soli]|uniref:N-acetyltransferase GCN5 n=1 Tax=Terrihabitans soli TaxID=708113 RepID=A0A6S6QQS2_9HYPH|nr:GNAT family N-acetyltransferase [Terrihabitans soli]BCJ89411.1 N-acetyltransferase GCN5 [Terrihabitans soli]
MICEELEFTQNEDCILRTGRLVLRRPRAEDATGIACLANDREIAENTARIPYPYTLAHAEAFIASSKEGDEHEALLAFAEVDGVCTAIGMVGVTLVEGVPQVGYWVGAAYRGKGFATELARAMVDHVFETTEADKINVSCRVTNTASRRVIEKCGFQWSGCGLSSSIGLKGSVPVDRFRLDRRIWESLIAWGHGRRERWPVNALSAKRNAETVTQ